MPVVVCHLTRMSSDYMCVAVLDLQHLNHVRPLLPGRLHRDMLIRNGGVFDIGAVVDLGPLENIGHVPEVEDRRFSPSRAVYQRDLDAKAFWKLLEGRSCSQLVDLFGPDLQPHGSGAVVKPGCGRASLGLLASSHVIGLYVNNFGGIRVKLKDGRFDLNLSVTDLRLYEDDQKTPRYKVVRNLVDRIHCGTKAVLAVGLGRPWARTGEDESFHWLQVNNIHMADKPLWTDRPKPGA